jgi:hypothetical protein
MAHKINLNIEERIHFPEILPGNGRLIEMEVVKNLTSRVRFSAKEIEEYELRDLKDGRVVWDEPKAKERQFQFEDSEILIIQKGIKTLDAQGRVTIFNLDLAKKFKAIKVKPRDNETDNQQD